MNSGLLARAAVLALVFGTVTAGTADASTPPMANAAFTRSGAPVYASDAVGFACQVGFCDEVMHHLDASAAARYHSTRPGEAVLVTCRSGDLTGVVGFFDTGDDVVGGWANWNTLQLRDGQDEDRLPVCGTLP